MPANKNSSPGEPRRKRRLAILVNMISPARIPLYSALGERFDLLLLHGGNESNRDTWHDVDRQLHQARVVKVWGWQIPLTRWVRGRAFDRRYLHLTPGSIWQLFRFRPDVIITNEMGLRTLIALTYATIARKPVWVWWGGTPHTERSIGTIKRIVRSLIAHWAKHWISYGKSSTEYLLTLGIDRGSVLQLQNSVDERRFLNTAEAAYKFEPRPVLLCVGQFTARKGIESLLRAAAQQQKRGQIFSLVFVGSGPERVTDEELSRGLGLKNVHFLPPREPARMPSIYKSADVLIFPTLEDVWGLVANEAILSGLPVLCSKYAGCANELFDPESIFNPQDPDEFSRKLGDAIALRLPRPDASRIRSTPELVSDILRALELSMGTLLAVAPEAGDNSTREAREYLGSFDGMKQIVARHKR
jgi:glycosyltransferase involved in cell wall biosynthesis